MTTSEEFLEGRLLLIDKPLGWTSFQAVNAIKWTLKRKFNLKKIKIGHAGTLDPLATGLLLICTGKFTKRIEALQGQAKEYTGTITLGASTPSYDLETAIDKTFPIEHISKELILSTALNFIGEQQQIPPVFSALKKDGKRLYEYAREGETVEIKPRTITISVFEITSVNIPTINFRLVCSKGSYVRSLAHDFGKALQSGAHLSELRRTKIGEHNVDNAVDPEHFRENMLSEGDLKS